MTKYDFDETALSQSIDLLHLKNVCAFESLRMRAWKRDAKGILFSCT